MKEILVYATDIHGDINRYERLFELGEGRNVKAVIIGGDIAPFLNAVGEIAMHQREFLEFYLIPKLREFRKKAKKDVFLIMGNDDFSINLKLLEKAEKDGLLKLLNQKSYKLGEKFIAGYSFVNESPFLLKDWEKKEKTMTKDLEKLAMKSDPKKTVYVMHAPPLGTSLDVIHSGEHVGSSAFREFIRKNQPYLTLHGHIHESPEMTGNWKDAIGSTVCVNPGDENILVFDMNNLEEMHVTPL